MNTMADIGEWDWERAAETNDQEKARKELLNLADDAHTQAQGPEILRIEAAVNAVLSADPRVIAEAMGARMVLMHCAHRDVPEQWAIVLSPRKVGKATCETCRGDGGNADPSLVCPSCGGSGVES